MLISQYRTQFIALLLIATPGFLNCSGSDLGNDPNNGFTFTDTSAFTDSMLVVGHDTKILDTIADSLSADLSLDSGAALPDIPPPPPEPGEFGYPCEDPEDCDSEFCVGSINGKVCTQFCFDECPLDWDCKEVKNPTGDPIFICLPRATNLCRPCNADGDCIQNGGELGDRCVNFSQEEGSFCGTGCANDSECPDGYVCEEVMGVGGSEPSPQCMPKSGQCYCNPMSIELSSETLCARTLDTSVCTGKRVCTTDGLSDCDAPAPEQEICNLQDEDCDGEIDEYVAVENCTKENDEGACPGITVCQEGINICKAPEASPEVCDGLDNDCNGTADEDFDDFDADGIADCIDTDDDNDGVPDLEDNCPFEQNPTQTDTDIDTKGDACDPDDDNDQVLDPSDNCPQVINADQSDLDGDGAGDACDNDDDGDTVFDQADNCPLVANTDQTDQDFNGVGDACDGDADGDSIANEDDNCPNAYNPANESGDQLDTDQDGQGDACDLDDDGDNVPDIHDNCPLISNPEQKNTDVEAPETQGDPLGDACDDDDDDDIFHDQQDLCPLHYNPGQENADGDSFGDACDDDKDGDTVCDVPGVGNGCSIPGPDNCPDVPNFGQENFDGDQWGDACDPDDDNDFILDDGDNSGLPGDRPCMSSLCPDCMVQCDDNCTLKWNPNQSNLDGDTQGNACDIDKDGDSIPNDVDNCPSTSNPGQENTDNEGEGDACDPDIDNDNIPNILDNCPNAANTLQEDQDLDLVGDACDPDLDGDNVCDAPGLVSGCTTVGPDNCIYVQNPGQQDNESDLLGDVCDPDDDNDGICDTVVDAQGTSACTLYGGQPGIPSGQPDNCPMLANPSQANFDNDAMGDACDPDDDNDNELDIIDCGDFNPMVNHNAQELCNGIDDNCVGGIDEAGTPDCVNFYYDNDGDGYGTSAHQCLCNAQAYYRANETGDCDDSLTAVNPGATEICNSGIDDDCVDGADPPGSPGSTKYYKDKDGDGYGLETDSMMLCAKDWFNKYSATNKGDCNDNKYSVHPGATEKCNGYDDDCVGGADEEKGLTHGGSGYTWYHRDSDNDGWGSNSDIKNLCGPSGSYDTTQGGDCCDADANAKPGQSNWFTSMNVCGSWDYNCNNNTDYQYNNANVNCSGGGFSSCTVVSAGWDGGRPGCAQVATWLKDCDWSWFSCKKGDSENRQQKCR